MESFDRDESFEVALVRLNNALKIYREMTQIALAQERDLLKRIDALERSAAMLRDELRRYTARAVLQ
jgi:hypothetical protein